MKYIISIVIAAVVFFIVGFSLDGFTRMSGDDITVFAGIAGGITLIASLFTIHLGKSGTSIASDAICAVKDIKETIEASVEDKQGYLYARAEEEYDNGVIDKGLWSQALVKAKGDEQLRKVEYMTLRVKQLKKKHNRGGRKNETV